MPAVPASSSSEHSTERFSRSAWGDGEGGPYQHFFIPEQFANSSNSSWWLTHSFLDINQPQLDVDGIDWPLDEELLPAITTVASTTAFAPSALEPQAYTPSTAVATTDWPVGFGMFDSNHPTVESNASGNSGTGSQFTQTTSTLSHRRADVYHRHVDPELALKRQRNKVAAQKYRQKKLDRISELELEVAEVKSERDELRIQLAKQEAETAALREMLKLANPGGMSGS